MPKRRRDPSARPELRPLEPGARCGAPSRGSTTSAVRRTRRRRRSAATRRWSPGRGRCGTPAGRTTCAGRSLSSDHGSSAASTPSTNSPAGTSTASCGTVAPGGSAAPGPSSGAPSRSWWVASIVSSCICSCCSTMTNGKASVGGRRGRPALEAVEARGRGRRRGTRGPRRGLSSGRRDPLGARVLEGVVELLDLRRQHALRGGVATAQQPQVLLLADVREVPDQRAHQRAVLAGQLGSSNSVSSSVRIRDRSNPARASSMRRVAMSRTGFLLQDGERAGGGGAVAQLVAGRAAALDQLGVGLDVGFQRRRAAASRDVDAALDGRAQGRDRPARRGRRPDQESRTGAHSSAARSARPASSISVTVERGQRRPPPVGQRVEAADLEVAARPDRREQRRQVVVEVGQRWAAGRSATAPRSQPANGTRPGDRRASGRRRGRASPARRARSPPTPAPGRGRRPGRCGCGRCRARSAAASSASPTRDRPGTASTPTAATSTGPERRGCRPSRCGPAGRGPGVEVDLQRGGRRHHRPARIGAAEGGEVLLHGDVAPARVDPAHRPGRVGAERRGAEPGGGQRRLRSTARSACRAATDDAMSAAGGRGQLELAAGFDGDACCPTAWAAAPAASAWISSQAGPAAPGASRSTRWNSSSSPTRPTGGRGQRALPAMCVARRGHRIGGGDEAGRRVVASTRVH